jgi:uncharacterized membrane-anchored protein YitT (DUF2179 family)
MRNKPALSAIGTYFLILVGLLLYAVSVQWFFVTNTIAYGGVTGIAMMIHAAFGAPQVGTLIIVLNLPLFLFSSCIYGGLLSGISLGVVTRCGASTGGIDIAARLVKLKLGWLPFGRLMLIMDLAVIFGNALVFRNLNSALYGLVALYISSIMIDAVLYGIDRAKFAYIISDKPEEITRYITGELSRGVTILSGRGAYSGAEKQVLLCAFKTRQIVEIRKAVKEIDPNAFLIVSDANEILGDGFGEYKKNSF